MDDQAKIVDRNGSPVTVSRALAQDVGEFAHDVFTLAELQAQLFVADLQQCAQRALVPGLLLLVGVALGLSCIPFALAALALLLIQVFELSYAAGFVAATIVGAIVSALLCSGGWLLLRTRLTILRRSQEELMRNLRWIKKVLERHRVTRSSNTDNSWRTVR